MSNQPEPIDLVWGAKNIAATLGVSTRQAFHMLEKGELPCKQIGSRWVASRKALERFFEGETA